MRAGRGPAHWTNVGFVETNRLAIGRRNQNLTAAIVLNQRMSAESCPHIPAFFIPFPSEALAAIEDVVQIEISHIFDDDGIALFLNYHISPLTSRSSLLTLNDVISSILSTAVL